MLCHAISNYNDETNDNSQVILVIEEAEYLLEENQYGTVLSTLHQILPEVTHEQDSLTIIELCTTTLLMMMQQPKNYIKIQNIDTFVEIYCDIMQFVKEKTLILSGLQTEYYEAITQNMGILLWCHRQVKLFSDKISKHTSGYCVNKVNSILSECINFLDSVHDKRSGILHYIINNLDGDRQVDDEDYLTKDNIILTICKNYLNLGGNVDKQDEQGNTALLLLSLQNKSVEMPTRHANNCEELIPEFPTSPEGISTINKTKNIFLEIFKLLLNHGTHIELCNNEGISVLNTQLYSPIQENMSSLHSCDYKSLNSDILKDTFPESLYSVLRHHLPLSLQCIVASQININEKHKLCIPPGLLSFIQLHTH